MEVRGTSIFYALTNYKYYAALPLLKNVSLQNLKRPCNRIPLTNNVQHNGAHRSCARKGEGEGWEMAEYQPVV